MSWAKTLCLLHLTQWWRICVRDKRPLSQQRGKVEIKSRIKVLMKREFDIYHLLFVASHPIVWEIKDTDLLRGGAEIKEGIEVLTKWEIGTERLKRAHLLTVKDFRCKFLTIFFRNHRNTDIEIQKYNICGILWQKEMKIQKYKDAKKQKYIDAEYKFRIQREYNAETPFLLMSVELGHLHSFIGLVWLWPILASPTNL